ncbi:hypothetical protein MCAV_06550 [[Mycoplasma] cavipharyngis]|uniref:hypothetical protein n=1 Tax=[Mycoplasma] cavipharyngis TaxID=92757 RepID=UPI0037041431
MSSFNQNDRSDQVKKLDLDNTKNSVVTTNKELVTNNQLVTESNLKNDPTKNNNSDHIIQLIKSFETYDLKPLLHFYHNYTLSLLKKVKFDHTKILQQFKIKINYNRKLNRYSFDQLKTISDYQKLIQTIENNKLIIFRNYQTSFLVKTFANQEEYQQVKSFLDQKNQKLKAIISEFENLAPGFFDWQSFNSEIENLIIERKTSFDHAFIYLMTSWFFQKDDVGKFNHFLLKQYQVRKKLATKYEKLEDILSVWAPFISLWKKSVAKFVVWDQSYEKIFNNLLKIAKRILSYRQNVFLKNYFESKTENF